MNRIEYEKAVINFNNSYEFENGIDTSKIDKKTYFSAKDNPKYCRFCDKLYPEISFKTDAHLIPKFLGSKYLLSHFECDNCNAKFKKYENDFANFIGVIRSISGIKGKSKNPKYLSKDLTIFQEDDKTIRFVSPDLVSSIKEGENQFLLKTVKSQYRPIYVFKALLKIALCLIDKKEVDNFKSTFRFLQDENKDVYNKIKSSLKICRIFVPGPPVPETPIVHLWRRKDIRIEIPEKIMVIHVKNLKYQIPIPLNASDKHLDRKSVEVPIFPISLPEGFIDKYGKPQFEIIDLSSKDIIKNREEHIGLNIKDVKRHY